MSRGVRCCVYIYGGLSATYTFVYAIEQVSRPLAANCSLQQQQHPFVNQSTSVHCMYVSCRNTGSLPSCQHDLTQYSSTDLQDCFWLQSTAVVLLAVTSVLCRLACRKLISLMA